MGRRGVSSPPYSFDHSGPVIVAGYALCLHDDLEQAWKRYPDAPVIAVNGAAKAVKAIGLYSFHPERFETLGWRQSQTDLFGSCPTHAPVPEADYVWPDTKGGGGSAWGARKTAALMGFDLVILCGCPMIPGVYVGNHNFSGGMHDQQIVDDLFQGMVRDEQHHKGCISMSGRTRELLGC